MVKVGVQRLLPRHWRDVRRLQDHGFGIPREISVDLVEVRCIRWIGFRKAVVDRTVREIVGGLMIGRIEIRDDKGRLGPNRVTQRSHRRSLPVRSANNVTITEVCDNYRHSSACKYNRMDGSGGVDTD